MTSPRYEEDSSVVLFEYIKEEDYMMERKMALVRRIGIAWGQVIITHENREYFVRMEKEIKKGAREGWYIMTITNALGLTFYRVDDLVMVEAANDVNVGDVPAFTIFELAWYPREKMVRRGVTFFRMEELHEIEIIN